MILTTAELVYINEAAKALKQKDFMIIGNIMIGLDNIQNILTYIALDGNFITNYIEGAIINARALSAFIKSLSVSLNPGKKSTKHIFIVFFIKLFYE